MHRPPHQLHYPPVTRHSSVTRLTTARLVLRPFDERDLDDFAALNADPRVREFFPSVLTRDESDAAGRQYCEHWARHGFGRFTVEVPGVTGFAGVVGVMHTPFTAHFTPAAEIGWRVPYAHWGHGYASEAARAVCEHGLRILGLPEIVAFTVPANTRSRRVMAQLGMTHSPSDDFDHPLMPPGHPLRRHVLYRLARSDRS